MPSPIHGTHFPYQDLPSPSVASLDAPPQLPHPDCCPELRLIMTQGGLEHLSNKMQGHCTRNLQRKTAEYEAVEPGRLKAIEDTARAREMASSWSVLSLVSATITSLFSLVWGGSVGVAAGGPLFMAVGVLTAASAVLSKGEHWKYVAKRLSDDEQIQRMAQVALPAALTLFILGLSAAGVSRLALAGLNAQSIMAQFSRLSGLLEAGVSIAGIGATLQGGRAEQMKIDVDQQSHLAKSQMEAMVKFLRALFDRFKVIERGMSHAIQQSVLRS